MPGAKPRDIYSQPTYVRVHVDPIMKKAFPREKLSCPIRGKSTGNIQFRYIKTVAEKQIKTPERRTTAYHNDVWIVGLTIPLPFSLFPVSRIFQSNDIGEI